MVHINDLPNEILEFIISLLHPYKDLDLCGLVCKRWGLICENVILRKKQSLDRGLDDFNLCWKSEEPCKPCIGARYAHSSCFYDNAMYCYGGASNSDTTFNDLWKFDLSRRIWVRPSSIGAYPSPKAGTTLVCHKDHLILFGGWRPSSNPPFQMCTLFDELHTYNMMQNRWAIHNLPFGPHPVGGHSATIHNNRMVVFGGYQKSLENYGTTNDLWVLDLDKLAWRKPAISDVKPAPRYGQYQLAIDDDHILIVGGNGGPNNIFSDAWILDMRGTVWKWKNLAIKNRNCRATQIFCYPACNVGNKLVFFGPSPSPEVLLMRQKLPNPVPPPRPQPINDHVRHPANLNRRYLLRPPTPPPLPQPMNLPPPLPKDPEFQQPGPSNEAARRNPLFRNNDDDHLLPRRFNQVPNGHMGMAAFSVPSNHPVNRERQLEKLRRMEEKIQLRRAEAAAKKEALLKEKTKRIRKNGIAIYVCDISQVLATEPYVEWMETKNHGVIADAPDKFTFSTVVRGIGELILFGGLLTSPNSEVTSNIITNSIHILTVPNEVV